MKYIGVSNTGGKIVELSDDEIGAIEKLINEFGNVDPNDSGRSRYIAFGCDISNWINAVYSYLTQYKTIKDVRDNAETLIELLHKKEFAKEEE